MKQSENIYLVGLMGAGKTTVGRLLSRSLQLPFYDSDKAIEEHTGVDVSTIFEFEGEEGFRNREQKMIDQLTKIKGIVMATGGGAVLREDNRNLLMCNGFVVYLHCDINKLLERTRRDSNRPLLDTEDPKARLETLFSNRQPLYAGCADLTVDTGVMQSKEAVVHILECYQAAQN
ncbi:MAG: shikimate kinase AroK [Methylococcales bacterium]|nr:shikimate kinase AroK [Methylococcales bacterium]